MVVLMYQPHQMVKTRRSAGSNIDHAKHEPCQAPPCPPGREGNASNFFSFLLLCVTKILQIWRQSKKPPTITTSSLTIWTHHSHYPNNPCPPLQFTYSWCYHHPDIPIRPSPHPFATAQDDPHPKTKLVTTFTGKSQHMKYNGRGRVLIGKG